MSLFDVVGAFEPDSAGRCLEVPQTQFCALGRDEFPAVLRFSHRQGQHDLRRGFYASVMQHFGLPSFWTLRSWVAGTRESDSQAFCHLI